MIGSPPATILSKFEKDPQTKAVVIWGEPGTTHEEDAAAMVKQGGFTKPLIVYMAGRFVESMPEGTVFGHAASIIEGGSGRPSTKMVRFKDAGAHVAQKFNEIIEILQKVMKK